MSEARIVCAGYLKKSPPERRLMRTWHKRYFVLKSDKTLTYYPNEKDKKPVKAPIDLNYCQSIEANLNHNNKHFKHVFSVITTTRTYYLVADSREDMDKWVKNLCKWCGFEKQDGKPSPDFVRNRPETKPKDINMPPTQHATMPSPMTPSPPAVCPLSPPKSPSMPTLSRKKDRSQSDPPDSEDVIRKAERQYLENRERRRSIEFTHPSPGNSHMTLPALSQVPEYYDQLPPMQVDGGYESLKPPPVEVGQSNRLQPQAKYSTAPQLRPQSGEIYDVVPSHNRYSRNSDELYDFPSQRNPEQGANYDIVPPPRPASSNEDYDVVPKHIRNSYNPDQMYDVLPPRQGADSYDENDGDVYDIVPPPRPQNNDSYNYDTLPPPQKNDDLYDIPPNMMYIAPPARPPKSSNITPANAKDHYDIVPAPGAKLSRQEGLEMENRDSGSYSDEIYDVPPIKQTMVDDNDIYDVPPRPSDDDVYDELPRRDSGEDIYDIPPTFSAQDSLVAPMVNRASKPPPVRRDSKPSQDYTNLAPPAVDRKCKPAVVTRPNGDHSYENMGTPIQRGQLMKSHSIPESDVRNCNETDYTDMQPYRSEDTRCYSISKDYQFSTDCYEEMEPQNIKRESGVHSNSSSSEDGGDSEECYMTMGPPEKPTQPQRKAALQYCEVQIVDGQTKSHVPVPRRSGESNYTTINEESTQAFRQTCRQQESSRN